MKNFALIAVHFTCAFILFSAACSEGTHANLKGKWHTADKKMQLEITGKHFITNEDSPITEDYFVKEDTIFTSFEGMQPYSRFVIQKLDSHHLKLLYPDSVSVDFVR